MEKSRAQKVNFGDYVLARAEVFRRERDRATEEVMTTREQSRINEELVRNMESRSVIISGMEKGRTYMK